MDIEDLFIGEIHRQCIFVLMAYDGLTKSLELTKQGDTEELDRFWYSIQAFLVAVANVSKILWPYAPFGSELPAETSARRERLRNLLSLEEYSPLKPRKFRNHFEHYDFEIEEWATKSKDRMLIDSNIGPIDLGPGIAPGPIAYMRDFDPVKFTLISRDDEYQIREVVKAINDLLQKIKGSYS
ncbi:MAG: hypothetical protein WAM14_21055 [Candidatus Nitrosopolaris sp.]